MLLVCFLRVHLTLYTYLLIVKEVNNRLRTGANEKLFVTAFRLCTYDSSETARVIMGSGSILTDVSCMSCC